MIYLNDVSTKVDVAMYRLCWFLFKWDGYYAAKEKKLWVDILQF